MAAFPVSRRCRALIYNRGSISNFFGSGLLRMLSGSRAEVVLAAVFVSSFCHACISNRGTMSPFKLLPAFVSIFCRAEVIYFMIISCFPDSVERVLL